MDDEDLGVEVEEVEVKGFDPITKLLRYIPLRKGKTKVPKDIDESKVALDTPLLLDEIVFERPHLGRVPLLNLEDWDLADHEKFLHLAKKQLIPHCSHNHHDDCIRMAEVAQGSRQGRSVQPSMGALLQLHPDYSVVHQADVTLGA